MPKKTKKDTCKEEMCKNMCKRHGGGCDNALYFVGFVGAAVHYIQAATGFWMGVLGVLKALAWPAFLAYEILKFVGA